MPTITFSGLASGLDTNSWVEALVSVKQTTVTSLQTKLKAVQNKQSTITTLQASFSSLRSSIEKLTDAKFGGSMDLFANNKATSSDENIFIATATQSASRMSYNIRVDQLATNTSVSAKDTVSAVADDETKLSALGITKGSLTVYVDGKKNTINIGEDDTVQDLKAKLSADVKVDINEDGKLAISAMREDSTVLVGATNDTSNFKSVLGIEQQEDGTYLSNAALYKATSTSKVLESGIFGSDITAGTFTIGDAEFTIDENTTINDLISKINNNEGSHATAFWDSANAKLVLNSTVEGQSYINIEAGTSNFTDVMQFTSSEWDEDGNLVSTSLNIDNQTLGDNAILYINGSKVTSTSNIVTSDISRLTGVTLNLKSVSTEESGTTTLDVQQDTSKVVDALKDFVDKYNEITDKLDELTASDGELYGDTSLNNIKRSLRSLITSSTGNRDDVFTMLNQVGISTASIGASISDDTNKLSLDKDALEKALSENSDAVKKLLMGSTSSENGIFSKIENIVEETVSSKGYFTTITNSLKSEVNKYETKITKQTDSIASYKASLESKFAAMEKIISSLQQGYSNFLSS